MNVIYNQDCIEGMRARLEGDSVDMVLTSPPYGTLREYNGYSFDFEGVADELVRVLRSGGVIVWVVGDLIVNYSETGNPFRQALYFMDKGLNLHDTMIYNKTSCQYPDTTRYYQVFEYMFVLSKGRPSTFNPLQDRPNKTLGQAVGGFERKKNGTLKVKPCTGNVRKEYGVRFNVWTYTTGYQHSYKEEYLKSHPAVMHVQLARDHVLSWSNEGDLILDPFMGSGTVAVAAKELGRNYVGFEISSEYINLANRRLGLPYE